MEETDEQVCKLLPELRKEKVMEEISNEVLLLAQQPDLEIDTEDADQAVQNFAEKLAIEALVEVEAQKIAEEQETEKEPTEATGSRRICRKFLKVKKGKLSLFTP